MQFYSSLLVLALAASSATALNKIKCYSCTSETNPHCNDPINTEGDLKPLECTNDLTNDILSGVNTGLKGLGNFFGLEKTPQINANFVCLKGSYTRTEENGKEKKVVIRSCSLEGSKICDTLNQKSKEQGIKDVFCQECTGDACNGSSALAAAAFLLFPAVALLLASR